MSAPKYHKYRRAEWFEKLRNEADRRFHTCYHKPEDPNACWEWTAYKKKDGYGTVNRGGKTTGAHVHAYTLLIGPIPKGLVVDHLCRNRGCVNPNHLELVTHRENIMRGVGASAKNLQKTQCINGHPFTPENIYAQKLPGGGIKRRCKTCEKRRESIRRKSKVTE